MSNLSDIDRPERVEISIVDNPDFRFNYNLEYYLAGPMSGYPQYNYGEFEAACRMLRANKITVHSPHEIVYPASKVLGDRPYQEYIDGGMKLLRRCSGIILLPGWPQSTGALLELSEATQMNFPVYFLHDPYEIYNDVQLVSMNRVAKS